jgi:hypothetical protein
MYNVGVAIGDVLRSLVRIAALMFVGYLCLAANFGYQVGHGIYEAKASNALAAIGANIVGREYTEQYAIQQAQVPALFTESPTFWIGLRAAE